MLEREALALASVDGKKPHVIAVGFVKKFGNKLLISDNYMNRTPKNILKNPNVAVAVWNKNWKSDCKGFELRGTAKYLKTGKWAKFVKAMPENKGLPAKGAIVLTVKEIKRLA